jgi:hypothetical protein
MLTLMAYWRYWVWWENLEVCATKTETRSTLFVDKVDGSEKAIGKIYLRKFPDHLGLM